MKPIDENPYRSRAIADKVIGLSISYEHDNLLARGLGLEHLRELLVRLARPALRQGAHLAYGGNWKEGDDNFTYELLRLISAEQEDNSLTDPGNHRQIGRLFNHLSWPYYIGVTPQLEAQWINCCRIIRITQSMSGFSGSEIVSDSQISKPSDRLIFNRAVALSAMRRRMLEPISLDIAEAAPESIPPVVARVVMGGRVQGYAGFMPGIFEEFYTTLAWSRPVYILGGFGGAAEVLAQAILDRSRRRNPEMTMKWHEQRTPDVKRLALLAKKFRWPTDIFTMSDAFERLWKFVLAARRAPAATLRTGLTDEETRNLLTTRDMNTAIRLVRHGLEVQHKLPKLAA